MKIRANYRVMVKINLSDIRSTYNLSANPMINLKRFHHVAYRCKDAKETVDWYQKHLNLSLIHI